MLDPGDSVCYLGDRRNEFADPGETDCAYYLAMELGHQWMHEKRSSMEEPRRAVRVNDTFRLDVNALRAVVTEDLATGLRPFCVAASAGTVNTGAIHPLAGTRAAAVELSR